MGTSKPQRVSLRDLFAAKQAESARDGLLRSELLEVLTTWGEQTSKATAALARGEVLRAMGPKRGGYGSTTWMDPEDAMCSLTVTWADVADELAALECPGTIVAAMLGLPAHPVDPTAPPAPMPRLRAQEEAILAKLVSLGYTPDALPKPKPGFPSEAKQAVKAALQYSEEQFGKAWLRLRKDGRIADDE